MKKPQEISKKEESSNIFLRITAIIGLILSILTARVSPATAAGKRPASDMGFKEQPTVKMVKFAPDQNQSYYLRPRSGDPSGGQLANPNTENRLVVTENQLVPMEENPVLEPAVRKLVGKKRKCRIPVRTVRPEITDFAGVSTEQVLNMALPLDAEPVYEKQLEQTQQIFAPTKSSLKQNLPKTVKIFHKLPDLIQKNDLFYKNHELLEEDSKVTNFFSVTPTHKLITEEGYNEFIKDLFKKEVFETSLVKAHTIFLVATRDSVSQNKNTIELKEQALSSLRELCGLKITLDQIFNRLKDITSRNDTNKNVIKHMTETILLLNHYEENIENLIAFYLLVIKSK